MIFVKIVTKITNKYKNYIRYRKLRRKFYKPRDLHTKYLLLLCANRNYPFVTTFYHSNTNCCCNSMQIENALLLPHFTTATANFCCNSEQIETIVLLPLTTFYHSNTNCCCNSMQIETMLFLPHLPNFYHSNSKVPFQMLTAAAL